MSAGNRLWRRQFLPRTLELAVPAVFLATLVLVASVYLALDLHRAYQAFQSRYEVQANNLVGWVERYLDRTGKIVRGALPPQHDPCTAESRAGLDRELAGLPVSRVEVWSQGGFACAWRPQHTLYYFEACAGEPRRDPVEIPITLGDRNRLVVLLDAVCLFGALVPQGGASPVQYLVPRPSSPKPVIAELKPAEHERGPAASIANWSFLPENVVVTAPASNWPVSVVVSAPNAQLMQEWLGTLPLQACLIGGLGLALWFGPMALVRRRLSVEGQVKAALRRGDFFLAYLPTVELASLDWIGAEALLRWRHARHGVLMPTAFIPWIEESPLIYDTTRWVMIQVARDLKRITIQRQAFSVALNVPPHQLSDRRLLDVADEAFGGAPLALERVIFEITERQQGDFSSASVREVMQGLRDRGAQFALDDFGVGFSNLSLLQQVEVDFVKIDRSFLKVEEQERAEPDMLEAVVHLVRKLGAVIIVEGIETERQLVRVRRCGVPFAQGFLFSRPIELEVLLAKLGGMRGNVRSA
ncbi:EAL domain-containing protein [Xanthobacter sediminis]